MTRRIAAIVAACVGVYLLVGPGWALLALAGGLEAAVPRQLDARTDGWVAQVRSVLGRLWVSARALPAQVTGATSATVGVVLVPVGVSLWIGIPAGLVILGVLALSFGLILDRA